MTRAEIARTVGVGGRTFQIAKRCGVPTGVARYHLLALERSGWVERDTRYSADNDIYWRSTPQSLVYRCKSEVVG